MPAELKNPRQRCRMFRRPPSHAVAFEPEPETICYRGQTLAIVRHFFEISSQLGRIPSILGREFFRAKVSHHSIPSFEDQALFVHDVRRSLGKLNDDELQVITLLGLYDVTLDAAAAILHLSTGCLSERYSDAISRLTQNFLDTGVLRRDRPDRRQLQMKCRPGLAARSSPRKSCASVQPMRPNRRWRAEGS